MIEAKAESDASPLLAMPWEVVLHVLSFLDPFDLCVVAQACSVRAECSFDSWPGLRLTHIVTTLRPYLVVPRP